MKRVIEPSDLKGLVSPKLFEWLVDATVNRVTQWCCDNAPWLTEAQLAELSRTIEYGIETGFWRARHAGDWDPTVEEKYDRCPNCGCSRENQNILARQQREETERLATKREKEKPQP